MPELMQPAERNISLCDYIRWYDAALPAVFCQRMISAFNAATSQQVERKPGWRIGLERSGWVELDITPLADASLRELFSTRIREYLCRYNDDLALPIRIPEPAKLAPLRIKRYRPGGIEGFQLHFDALGDVANRYLVFLWYLNDVEHGGETTFPSLDVTVSARAGRLLIFPPYWMYQHEGRAPVSGDKYILSTYLLFTGAAT